MTTSTQYSLEQVSEMNTGECCVVIIHNSVYDVTKYLSQHPGGEEILQDFAGKDCTEEFDDIGHSNSAKSTLEKFKIGELEESERKSKNDSENAKSGILGWFGF